jgi:hypothetical protein
MHKRVTGGSQLTVNVPTQSPVVVFHRRKVLSREALTSSWPSMDRAMALTASVCACAAMETRMSVRVQGVSDLA